MDGMTRRMAPGPLGVTLEPTEEPSISIEEDSEADKIQAHALGVSLRDFQPELG
jgi:hypothetical protein